MNLFVIRQDGKCRREGECTTYGVRILMFKTWEKFLKAKFAATTKIEGKVPDIVAIACLIWEFQKAFPLCKFFPAFPCCIYFILPFPCAIPAIVCPPGVLFQWGKDSD